MIIIQTPKKIIKTNEQLSWATLKQQAPTILIEIYKIILDPRSAEKWTVDM